MRKILLSLLVLFTIASGTWADGYGLDPLAGVIPDNPALQGSQRTLSLGVSLEATDSQLSAWSANTLGSLPLEMVFSSPLVGLSLKQSGPNAFASTISTGGGLGIDSVFSLASGTKIALNSDTNSQSELLETLGFATRFFDILSLGYHVDNPFGENTNHFLGAAFRPLAFFTSSAHWLTAFADFAWTENAPFSIERVGAQIDLNDILRARVSYDFDGATNSVPLSISAQLSLPGLVASYAYSPETQTHRLFSGTEFASPTKPLYRDLLRGDTVVREPSTNSIISFIFGPQSNNPEAKLNALEEAAEDERVQVMVFTKAPRFSRDQLNRAHRALDSFTQRGGRVIAYLHGPISLAQYALIGSYAAQITIDPNSLFYVQDVSAYQFYYRELLEKLGIVVRTYESHDTKTAMNIYKNDTMEEAERMALESYVEPLRSSYLELLEGANPMRYEALVQYLAGDIDLVPQNLVDRGIVDQLAFPSAFEEQLEDQLGSLATRGLFEQEYRSNSWGRALSERSYARVDLVGTIMPGSTIPGYIIGSEDTVRRLDSLRENPNIHALLLYVDSPGGSALASERINGAVSRWKDSGKPVAVVMGSVAASGGYMVSAAADVIYADAMTLTGSIGVTAAVPDGSGLLEKLGVAVDGFQYSEYGTLFDPTRGASPSEQAALRAYIDDSYLRFISLVAAQRDMDVDQVDRLAQGRVWTGAQALDGGLIDGFGGLEEADGWIDGQLGYDARARSYSIGGYGLPMSFSGLALGVEQGIQALTSMMDGRGVAEALAAELGLANQLEGLKLALTITQQPLLYLMGM